MGAYGLRVWDSIPAIEESFRRRMRRLSTLQERIFGFLGILGVIRGLRSASQLGGVETDVCLIGRCHDVFNLLTAYDLTEPGTQW